MNPNQTLFMRISHHGEATRQFEVPDLRAAMTHIFESYVEATHRKVIMTVELANHPFTTSLLTREQQLEQSINANAISDPNEIMYPPDVTLGECLAAWASPEGELMFRYQRAENRIGVDPERLAQIKAEYESKFPRVAPHGPKWSKT